MKNSILSKREKEVFDLLILNNSTQDIANNILLKGVNKLRNR